MNLCELSRTAHLTVMHAHTLLQFYREPPEQPDGEHRSPPEPPHEVQRVHQELVPG